MDHDILEDLPMSKRRINQIVLICLLGILFSLVLSGCTDDFEAEKLAEDTAVILNQWWDYASRFFITLKDHLTCMNGVAAFLGMIGIVWRKFR